jgi:hypothetical protein
MTEVKNHRPCKWWRTSDGQVIREGASLLMVSNPDVQCPTGSAPTLVADASAKSHQAGERMRIGKKFKFTQTESKTRDD